MDTFAPALLPDETLYSWIARWGILSGYPSHRSALRILLGSDNKQLSSIFPSFLPQTHSFARKTLDELINEHTALPFFKSFISEENYRRAKSSLLCGDTDFLHSRLSLVANRISVPLAMQYCSICSQKDYEEIGCTYWRLNHQLPGISMCLLHQKRLERVKVARRELVLPVIEESASKYSNEISISEKHLCKLITDSFEDTGSSIENCRLRDRYISMLRIRGLATDNDSIKMNKFRQELINYWNDLSDELALQILSSSSSSHLESTYPANIFYQQNCQYHPLKHLLIIGFLFGGWKEFQAEIAEQGRHVKKLNSSEFLPEPKGCNSNKSDELTIIQSLKKSESMRSIALQMNRSIGYVKKLAYLNDIKTESRAQKLFQTERVVVIELAKQGHSSSLIARELGCSVGAVEQIMSQISGLIEDRKRIRFINKRDKHRGIILKLVKTHYRRTDIQKVARSSYTYLFKHDKKWLNKMLPPSTPHKDRYLGGS